MQNQEQSTHPHIHGENCGHRRIVHNDHIDYLHDGHLHHVHGTLVEEHVLEVTNINPDSCKKIDCKEFLAHEGNAEKVPHGDHFDFLVNDRLHHVHKNHCDDHGPVSLS